MTAPGSTLLVCRDGRVIAVRSGPYVHDRPLTEPVDQVALVTALTTEPLPEPHSSLVHAAPGAERSKLMRSYLGGLTAGTRERLVVKPSRVALQPIDVAALEELSDLHDLPLALPVADELKQSARAVPVDDQGYETVWSRATSVRLQTRGQAAARLSARDALRTAAGTERPSVRRLSEWARRSSATRDGLGGSRVPAAAEAFAAYVVRFGVPDDVDVEPVLRPAMAPTLSTVLAELGATAAEADPARLVRGLLASPGSAALVRLRPAPDGPVGVAWLVSGDRASELFWLEPGAGLVPVSAAPGADDPHLALLRHPETRVAPVDATGRPVTVDALLGTEMPERPRLQRVNSGFSVVDDNLRDLVDAQVAHGRHLIGELVDLSGQQFVKESRRAATTVLVERVRVARAVSRLEHEAAQLPSQRQRVAPSLHEQIVARIAESVEHFGQVSEHASHRIRDLVEDATYQSYLATRDDKVRDRAKKLLGYASKALNMSGPLFLPAGASFAPAAMELGTTAATMAAVKAFESWQLRHFRNGHAVGEVWLAHDDAPLTMAKAIVKGQSEAFELLMSAAGIGGAYVPGWPIIASAVTKVVQRYLNERIELAERKLAGVDPDERKTLWRTVVDNVWRDLRSEVTEKVQDPGAFKEFVNAVRGEADVIGLVNVVSDVAVNAALGAVLALMPPKPAQPVTGEMLRAAVLGVVGMLKQGWASPSPTRADPLPAEPVPAGIAATDSEGRPVTHYRDALSDAARAYVAVTFNGRPVWGYLTRGTWTFEPVRPDESAFAEMTVWHNRIPGPDHYLELGPDGTRTRVEGSWYRPWSGQFHYLFVRADGVLEWAHAMAPTTRMDTDEYNVHRHFEEHPEWLRDFSWRTPDVLALDFDRAGFTPRSGTWAARQFAYSVANQLVADHEAPGGGAWRTRVHVEGGGNGRNLARSTWSQLRHEPADRAVESGQRRADATHAHLKALVTEELRRIATERGLAADDVPALVDDVFAAPTSRGSAPSRAPGRTTAGDERNRRQAYVWVERTAATPESSDPPSPVVSDDARDRPPFAHAAEHLAEVAEDLPRVTGADRDAVCVEAVRRFAAELYPEGRAPRPAAVRGAPLDDAEIGGHVFPGVADRHFTLAGSWADVRDRVVAAGPGAVAYVLMGRPGTIGHAAVAWYDGTRLVFADLTRPADERIAEPTERLPSAIDLRTLVVDRAGVVRAAPPARESASTARALVDAASTDATGTRYGADLGAPAQAAPPALQRASSKLTDHELSGIVDERIARGDHLMEVVNRLSRFGFVKESPANRVMVHHERSRLTHAMAELRRQAADVLGAETPTVTPEHVQAGAELFESVAEFSRLTADVGRRIGGLVLGEGVKGYLTTRNDRTGVWVKRALGAASKALSMSAPAFLPAGASAAPAALDFATTAATHASMKAFRHWQQRVYLRDHSAAEALLGHDDDPLTMAKAIVKSQSEAVELLMSAAGIGGAYVPGWPIVASAITKVLQGYLEERVKLAERRLADHEPTAQGRQLWNTIAENVWKGLYTEVGAKLKDPATIKQIVDAARGEADLLGLVNIGSDVAVSAMLGALLALMPPKPAEPVTGDMLRTAVSSMAGTAGQDSHASVPDEAGPSADETVPAGVRTEDSEGRPVTRYRADRSDERRAYVTVDFNGQSVWGHLDRDTGDFEPVEPHQAAFVDSHAWYNRTLAVDHYLQLAPDGADPATRTTVRGRWYRPSWDKFHYLYLFVRDDGTMEWAHGTAPTGRIAGPTSQVHQLLSAHPHWVREFTWRAPDVLAVDFDEGRHTATMDPWASRQFAYAIADRAVAARSAPGGAWSRPLIHVEGGGNGPSAVHEVVDQLRHGHADRAAESGQNRARTVHERLKALVAEELRRITAERGLDADELPASVDELFADPTSRGAELAASRAPGMAARPADDARNRQVYAWIEHVPISPEGSAPLSPVVSDDASGSEHPHRPSTVDAVNQALAIGAGRRNASAARLREWVDAVETLPDADLDTALADCVPRAYAAFVAYHGRAANTADLDAATDPARLRMADLRHLLGGSPEPLADVSRLRGWLTATPGAMALLRLPAEGDRPGHVFWLWSEPGATGATLRWVDTQEPGLLDREAFADPDDVHAAAVARPGVTVLRLDAGGRPVRTGGLTDATSGVAALTLAREVSAEPGMRQALNKVVSTRIVHGSGTPEQAGAADLRDDVRTVFLGGDERADRKTLDGALSARSRRPVRIVPAAPVSAALLDRLRGQAARSKAPVFLPGVGQRAAVVRGDLAAVWPDGMPGDWTRIGGDRSAGYGTVDTGHLARSIAPGETVTAGELVAAELRTARVPVHLYPLPGELTTRFGPEIEYDAAAGVDPRALNAAVIADLREFGLTEQDELANYHDTMLAGYRSDRKGWKVERDSTVTGEIVAPILPYGPGKWRQTWYDLALVRAVVRRHGGVYSERTGGHLHVSVADFGQQAPRLANLLRHVVHRMDVLFRIGANGLYHRGSGQTQPLPPRAFDHVDHLDWEGLIRLAGTKSALSLDALKDSVGEPERDHVEIRIPDGLDDLGHLQFVVRVVQRLVAAAVRSGPADYRPQRLGEHFGDRSADVDRTGLALVRDLFGADAPAIDEQLRAVWETSRWQPALENRVRRYGMEIGSVPAGIGTYGDVTAAQHRLNTAALRGLTRGMDQPVIVFHHVDARSLPQPGAPRSTLVDPHRNLATLRAMLANHGRPTPRPLVVLFEPPGSGATGAGHERALAELADSHHTLLVRPRGAGAANRVTTGPAGLSTQDGWLVREPGGRVRRLGPVLRRDELDELVARGPDAADTDVSDPGLWERLAGEPGDGGPRWIGRPPARVEPWLARTGAARGRTVLVLRPDRAGPGGVPQYSRARLDEVAETLAGDPILARTGVLLVTGDAAPVAALRREHRIATVFRFGGGADPGWRLVTWDGAVHALGDTLDHGTVERAFDHLDAIAAEDSADDAAESLAELAVNPVPAGPAPGGTTPAPDRPRDPLVTAPAGTAWDGRLLALGAWDGASRAQVEALREWAADMTRPVVAVHAPSAATRAATTADLSTTLLRFARAGVHPVVFVKAVDRGAFEELRDRYRPVTIQRTTAGMDDVWQLRTPDGEPDRLEERPTPGLFRRADELPGGPTGYELPPVLAGWLAANDWPDRERYLRRHAAELTDPEIAARLSRVPADEAAPYTVLLDVVTRNGGVSDPAEPRYVPRPHTVLEPDFTYGGRLPETFVVDYLVPRSSAQERKPWNDRLLRLVAKNALTPRQAAVLAHGVAEPNAASNARVFDAIDGVLAMSAEQAAGDPAANTALTELRRAMLACRVTPADRMTWVYRMDEFRDRLRADGREAHAALVEILTHTLANC
ncbi:MAG TPA: hypothetical protein VGN37_23425 [Actinocatenispora sp.]